MTKKEIGDWSLIFDIDGQSPILNFLAYRRRDFVRAGRRRPGCGATSATFDSALKKGTLIFPILTKMINTPIRAKIAEMIVEVLTGVFKKRGWSGRKSSIQIRPTPAITSQLPNRTPCRISGPHFLTAHTTPAKKTRFHSIS